MHMNKTDLHITECICIIHIHNQYIHLGTWENAYTLCIYFGTSTTYTVYTYIQTQFSYIKRKEREREKKKKHIRY